MYQGQLAHLPQVSGDAASYIIHENAIITGRKTTSPAELSVIGICRQREYMANEGYGLIESVVLMPSIDFLVSAVGNHKPGDQIPKDQARFGDLRNLYTYKSDNVTIEALSPQTK